MRFCITPRYGRGPDDDWYPWLARKLKRHEVVISRLEPSPRAPTIEACVENLRDLLDSDRLALEQTVLIGHSVGCHAQLRFLESLGGGAKVAGVLCVAGWWWLDVARDELTPWLDTPHNIDRVRSGSRRFVTLLGDDDPYTHDQARNRRAWEELLGARVNVVSGAGHFVRTREQAVLDALGGMVVL